MKNRSRPKPRRHRHRNRRPKVNDPAALALLTASAKTAPAFAPLSILHAQAGVEWHRAAQLARQLVKGGLWAVTGRAESTRYVITPDGLALLGAR